ncbi:acetyltransferase [Dictyobacter sp. S3.2.2.5]|uniref:Acetyltransferase n=1 Tax=Dictyobacter halimunensis TaxID=3026934 RepID=A0ABQ6FRD6_9CHLR|nr:acetyltransferase [Dictyobacter sp. S3.2.2.5]
MEIDAYLQRIKYQGTLEPTVQTLRGLHQSHMLTTPFENLSIHYNQPIVLQEALLYDKIVRHRRGGFCYELNGLFAWLLQQLGFQVQLLSAEVAGEGGCFSPAYDHLTLLLPCLEGADWLVDVGFGDSFQLPLHLQEDIAQLGGDGRQYRLRTGVNDERDYWFLQQLKDQQWTDQYRFTLQSHPLTDFVARCHYQQTSPESHFTRNRVCSLATTIGRITLSDLRFITTIHGERQERLLTSEEAYRSALYEYFGITI